MIVFFCHTGPAVGLGHVARCARVAEALKRRGVATALVAEHAVPPSLLEPFDDLTHPKYAHRVLDRAVAVVTDHPDRSEVRSVHPSLFHVVVTDTLSDERDADLVVDPNLGPTESGPRRLGGSAFALVDHVLLTARAHGAVRDLPERVVITCGAADPACVTERFVAAMQSVTAEIAVQVVVGPLVDRDRRLAQRAADAGFEVVVAPKTLGLVAAGADLALTTLGTTASELACVGVPNAVVAVSALQMPHLIRYQSLGVVESLGWHGELSEHALTSRIEQLLRDNHRRQALRDAGLAEVDGHGADRVADAVLRLAAAHH